MTQKPVWVPIALPYDEASATLGAVRYAFHQATTMGLPQETQGALARAMLKIAGGVRRGGREGGGVTFHVPTCECGHDRAEHVSVPRRGMTALYGVCLVPGCGCQVFREAEPAVPADSGREAA